jgi:alkanesulfonate monooxygenase SsuD/methylene tetrahydromethanopterin reductase-like flavin-dependent oxidoreductase (luciferase family)
MEAIMAERLGLAIIPGAGWRASDITAIAREAEDAGFEAIVAAEVNIDVMATAQLMGAATSRIKVGTWVANIYLRNSYVCGQGAALIADATGGRMVLGLGVSHQPVNQALGVAMGSPLAALRQYSIEVGGWLRGEGPSTHLPQRPSAYPVPVYLGALTSPTVELAGEVADGIMPIWWSPERVKHSRTWIDRGRAKAIGRPRAEIALGLPTFIGEDIEALREVARANLGLFPNLPFFQHLLRASGFAAEAELAEQGAGGGALTARVLDAICLIGPAGRCRERIAEYREAGLDLPLLWPAIGVEAARAVIAVFGRD